MRILIIDDSLTIRAMLEELLGRYARMTIVGSAGSADEALDMVNRFLPDMILLDLGLPGLNGISFMDAIHDHWHRTHIIVISSSTIKDSEKSLEAFDHGAEACFDKARIVQCKNELIELMDELMADRIKRGKHKGDAVSLPPPAPPPPSRTIVTAAE